MFISSQKTSSLNFLVYFGILFVALNISCKKDLLSIEKKILKFTIKPVVCTVDENQKTINAVLNYDADLTEIYPIIKVSEKAKVNPASNEKVDCTNPVIYTVTAEDGSMQNYTLLATKTKNNENKILTFNLFVERNGIKTVFPGVINEANSTVNVAVPFSQIYFPDLTSEITLSPEATVAPISGFPSDFTNPVEYKVTAQNGDQRSYTAYVKNSENYLKSFNVAIPGYPANVTIDIFPTVLLNDEEIVGITTNDYYVCYVLNFADISNLTPEITISTNAQIFPLAGPADFNNIKIYTITSESGSSRKYSVKFIKRSVILPNDMFPIVYEQIDNSSNYTTYKSISKITKVELINTSNNGITPCTITSSRPDFDYTGSIFFRPDVMPTDNKVVYKLKVYLENEEVILTGLKYILPGYFK